MATEFYDTAVESLKETCKYAEDNNKEVVLISHFATSPEDYNTDRNKAPNDKWDAAAHAYYCNDIAERASTEFPQVKTILSGHTHMSKTYVKNGIFISSNARGYPDDVSQQYARDFNARKPVTFPREHTLKFTSEEQELIPLKKEDGIGAKPLPFCDYKAERLVANHNTHATEKISAAATNLHGVSYVNYKGQNVKFIRTNYGYIKYVSITDTATGKEKHL
jgi:hypothetical protein